MRLLVEYLDTYMADKEAWAQLADIYISKQQYSQAAFCLEELLVLEPHNPFRHYQYASVLYTIGTDKSLANARKYFCRAAELNPGDVRSLFGILQCCNTVKDEHTAELIKFATDGLRKQLVGGKSTTMLAAFEHMVAQSASAAS